MFTFGIRCASVALARERTMLPRGGLYYARGDDVGKIIGERYTFPAASLGYEFATATVGGSSATGAV